jgi:hypothetical protein
MVSPAVSAEGRSTSLRPESRGRLRYKWSDIISTISGLLWGEGLSAPRGVYPEVFEGRSGRDDGESL